MRRSLALLTALVVVCFASVGFAQTTCPAPTIVQSGGSNPSCASAPVTLDAGAGWATYQWSNGATTRTITDSPATNTTYTVTVTDANGCQVTSAPLTITVSTPPTPAISAPSSVCAGGSATANVTQPQYSSYHWMIVNGQIDGRDDMPSVSFHSTVPGASNVRLDLYVTNADGCVAAQSVSIPITGSLPSLGVASSVCAGVTTNASVGGLTSNINWSITNGTLVGPTHSSTAHFTATTNPVTLTVTGFNGTCNTTVSRTIFVMTVAPPAITVDQSPLCPNTGDFAQVAPPPSGSWSSISWSITNGTITTGQNASMVNFTSNADGSAVTLTVNVTSSSGCTATNSVSIPARTITPPAIHLDYTPMCPGAGNFATADAPAEGSWQWIRWSVDHGSINGRFDQPMVTFSSDPLGQPTTLTVEARDSFGCTTTNSTTIPVRTITPPVINLDNTSMCPGATNMATVSAPAGGGSWADVQWSISNGYMYQPYPGQPPSTTWFQSAPTGEPATLTVTVTDNSMCRSTASVTIPVRTIAPPVINLDNTSMCSGATNMATVSVPAEGGSWFDVRWSIANGTIQPAYPGQSPSTVWFMSDPGGQPVTLTVNVIDGSFCGSSASVTIPARTVEAPTINLERQVSCPGGSNSAWVAPPASGSWLDVQWSVTNGSLVPQPYPGFPQQFVADMSGQPVVLTVTVTDNSYCHTTASATIPIAEPPTEIPAVTVSPNQACIGSGQPVSAFAALPQDGSIGMMGWSVTHATWDPRVPNNYPWFSFMPDGTGDPVVTATFFVNATGCTMSRSVTIPQATIDQPQVTGPDRICPGTHGTLTLANASSYTSHVWTVTGASIVGANDGASIEFVPDPGSYYVNIGLDASNDSGCHVTYAKGVGIQFVAAGINIGGPTAFCAGGSVTLSAYGAYENGTYLWSNGATTQSITVTQSGSYSVTTTNGAIGCTTTSAPVDVAVTPLPDATISASGPTTFCTGGSVTLTAPSGVSSYLWSNGATTQAITVTDSGNFSVTTTNEAGCSASSSPVAVSVNPLPDATITASGPIVFCDGGSVTLTAPAGAASYLWSNGATTQSITITSGQAPYTVTTTNASGCSSTSQATWVWVNPLPDVAITPSGSTNICEGESVTLTATFGGQSYLWSNGATTQSITVNQAGTYSVTMNGWGTGCPKDSQPVTVTVSPKPDATITPSGSTVLCAGASVTLSAPAGASSYLWSNGATTQAITVNAPATYSVTVTNANGCSATRSIVVSASQLSATISADGPTTFCYGNQVKLTASPGESYLWSDGHTTPYIIAFQSGSYTVTITDVWGCSVTSQPVVVTVNENPQVVFDTPGNTPYGFCGNADPTVTAIVMNAASFSWSTGETTATIHPTQSGDYTITAVSAAGCTIQRSIHVTILDVPKPVIVADGPSTFCGVLPMHVDIPHSDVMFPVQIDWLTGGAYSGTSGSTYTSSRSETLTVAVRFNTGCTIVSDPLTITHLPDPVVTIASSVPALCPGGTATLTAQGAPSGTTYLWSTGATTPSITVNTAGTYSVTATSPAGCTYQTQYTLAADPITKPVIAASGSTILCDGGQVTLSAPSGASSYLWSTGATTRSIAVMQPGSYTVTITNANGCSATSDPLSVSNDPTTVTISGGAATICPGTAVHLSAAVANGSATSYQWYGFGGQPISGATSSTLDITPPSSGYYFVRIADANGCTVQSNTYIYNIDTPSASITAFGPTTFCAGGSVTLTANSGASYLWSNGATTQSINVTATGDYSVTVTTTNNCSATSDATHVQVNTVPAKPVITANGNTTFCDGGSVTLNAPAGYTYVWSTGATTQSINVTSTGDYSVTVSNGNCTATSDATHVQVNTVPAKPVITANGNTTFCDGGSVTLTAPSGYTYSWSNGATTQSINVTSTGDYSVTVSNGNCTATSDATHVQVNTVPAKPTITYTGNTTFCDGGSITLNAPAGYASYLWSNNATTQSINATSTGDYSVKVSTASCQSVSSDAVHVTVNTVPAKPTITYTGNTTFCNGGSITLNAPAGYASYLWSNNATTQSINVTSTGDYSVKVSTAFCQSVSSDAVHVQVNTVPPTPSITPASAAICPGSSVTLSAPAGYTYLWSNGQTTRTINVTSAANYTVTVSNGNCTATSAPAPVTMKTTTSLTQPSNITIARNVTGTLSVSAQGNNLTYQWYSGAAGNTSTPLGTSSTQSVGPYKNKGTNSFWVRVTGDCGTASSSTVTVTVN